MRIFALGLKNPRFILAAILLLALRIFPNAGLSQTTYYWYGDAPDGNWKRGANGARWTGGLWDEPTSGNILMFDNNGWLSMNNNITGYSVHQLLFGANNTQARTIGGNNLSFNDWSGADPKIENQSTGSHTVSLNITGDSNDPLQLNPVSGDLTVSGTINNNGSWIEVYGDNSKMLTLSGVVSGGGGLAIKQYSKVKLAANHTYTGGTVIEEGELWFDPNSSLSGSVTVGSSSLQANVTKLFISDSDGGTTVTNAVVITNGNTATRFLGGLNTSGENTFSGTVTLGAETRLEVASGGTVNLSGVVSGGSGLVKIGAGTAKLSGANTFSGQTVISEGTISITNGNSLGTGQFNFGNAGTLTTLLVNSNTTITNTFQVYNAATNAVLNVASGTTTTLSGKFTQDGAKVNTTKFGKDGAGTLSLNNGTSDFNGQLQIGQGTVILGATAALGTNASTSARGVDLGLNVGDTSTANNVSLLASNGVTVGQSVYVAPNTTSATRTIGIASGGGTNTFSNEFYMDGNLTIDATAATDQVNMTGTMINTGGIIKTGSGNLVLSGANTYSGTTTISAGTVTVGAAGATGQLGTGNITNNGTLAFNRTANLTVTNIISGTGALTKTNTGTVTLSGANTFSGKVTVASGQLTVSGVSDTAGSGLGQGTQVELGSGANLQVTVGAGTTNTTTRALILNGNATLGASTGTLVWNGNVTNNGTAASTIFFNSPAAGTNVFGGIIGNTTNNSAVNLDFQNTQIWSLTGSNTYTGSTLISNGRLIVDKLASNGVASSVGAGSTIRFGGFSGNAPVLEYVGSGSTNNKQFKMGGGGTASTGGTILQSGTGALVFNNAAFNAVGDALPASSARALTLSGTNAADNTISGVIQNNDANNTVSIVKDGTGKWILSGANTYTGGTTVTAGTLQIGAGGTTGSVSGAITNNSALVINRSDASIFANVISGTGTVTKASGSGNLTLSGANTFSGKVTVASGQLTVSGVSDTAGSGLGQGTQVELGSGANLQVTVGAGTTNTTTRALILNGNATLGASTGTLVWNGNVTNNGTAASTIAFNSLAAGTNVFGGIIGNTTNNQAVALNFQNTQIWQLSGANTFTGDVTIGGGKVIVSTLANSGTASSLGQGTGAIRFGGFSTLPTLEYVGSGSTNNKQFKMGGGGTANTGGTILQSGTGALVFNNATFNVVGDGLPASSARALTLSGTNAADNTISGVIQNNDANNTVSIVKDGTGKWILSGANTYSGGTTISNGILQIGAGGSSGQLGSGNVTNNGTLAFNRTGSLTVSNAISGTGVLNVTNTGTVTLAGANTYSGDTAIDGATLQVSAANNLGASTNAVTITNRGTLRATANLTNSRNITIATGTTGYVEAAAGTTNTLSGTLSKNGSVLVLGGGGTHIVNGSITGANANSDLVVSNSTTTINSTNSYNGPTFIVAAGTLNNGTNNALPTDTALTLGQAGETSSTTNRYNLNGYSQTVASVATAGSSVNIVTNSTGTGNLTLNSSSAKSISNLTMGGSGLTLTKSGANTVTLASGNNIGPGTIAIQQGTLLLGAANQIGDSTAINLSGGTLNTAGYADAAGKLTVSANSTIQGLNSTSGSAFTFSDVDLSNYSTSSGSTLTFVNSSGGYYSLGTVFQISTVAANSWTGYSETSLNNFSQKIQFGNSNVGQISFGSGISGTTLTVAAIPDARVYSAAAFLLVLIGLTEYCRRRKTVSSKG